MKGRRVIVFILGFVITLLGMILTLQQWDAVVLVFKAFIGPALAVAGLVILFASTLNSRP